MKPAKIEKAHLYLVTSLLRGSKIAISREAKGKKAKEPYTHLADRLSSHRLMDDPELEAIRQRRMQEMIAQQGIRNHQNEGQQNAQEDAKREAEERRQLMLSQILSVQARERLARIALVKPDKARGVEDVILRAAQTGQITEKVSEERLISILEQINTQTTKQTKITIQRRRSVLEDDD
ncbi:hypothetical protein KFK09_005231 [Dendrobium nobile]|uniref:Programmed cell death protein 5 n=1 Tax=Dendrobium nobile TaxID=94219 RepID=A0A8T3C0Q6_DENNO|nr:hypothetical protein KFK09_005231 [Dendrobium nobile]